MTVPTSSSTGVSSLQSSSSAVSPSGRTPGPPSSCAMTATAATLTQTIVDQLTANTSVRSCSGIASPFPSSCAVHLGGSPAHAPAPSSQATSRVPLCPSSPPYRLRQSFQSRLPLPGLPTRALPLRSFAALSAPPFSSARPCTCRHRLSLRCLLPSSLPAPLPRHARRLHRRLPSSGPAVLLLLQLRLHSLGAGGRHRLLLPSSRHRAASRLRHRSAHDGVRVLGTVITEWEEGERRTSGCCRAAQRLSTRRLWWSLSVPSP